MAGLQRPTKRSEALRKVITSRLEEEKGGNGMAGVNPRWLWEKRFPQKL